MVTNPSINNVFRRLISDINNELLKEYCIIIFTQAKEDGFMYINK